jgi:OOP family OmpA-OmpF porin
MPERTDEDLISPSTPDADLAAALGPTVVAALRRSVRSDPQLWVETLFPILLPAIRMAVASALREMLATLNQILDQSLSVKRWQWRFEAWRTRKTFGEIVLLRTLVFRVEQLLLLDRHTGLLLASVAGADITPKNTDLVSAMLTALQDFVGHSFGVDSGAAIRELYVGEFCLLVEPGPRAALAAAVRGNAPAEVRETLRAAVDLIHQEFGAELRDFKGDAKPFERSRPILEGCLQAQYHRPDKASKTKLWVVAAALLIAVAVWAGLRLVRAWHWDRALAALGNTPGIAITRSGRSNGRYFLEGLRDPLAASAESRLSNEGIDPRQVSIRFRPFLSLDPELVVKRAKTALAAPDSVSVTVDGDILRLRGAAPHVWVLRARSADHEMALAGVRQIQMTDLIDTDLEALRSVIESAQILFPTNSSTAVPEQARVVALAAGRAREWIDAAQTIGRTPSLYVTAYTDPTGSEARNVNLRHERAAYVANLLAGRGIDRKYLSLREGKPADLTADAVHSRRVTILTHLDQGR